MLNKEDVYSVDSGERHTGPGKIGIFIITGLGITINRQENSFSLTDGKNLSYNWTDRLEVKIFLCRRENGEKDLSTQAAAP
ncbi:hypothetical protein [Neomoorella thermoacetica]|uniref:hypothetical protein n=1 Tax=Neomoorella thermoacetica TaxID=1525 RepID=UPI0015A549BC|nr:hypothetical protein [Moorella thermoacetica]